MSEAAQKVINGLIIDTKIFTFKFTCKCTGECCNYGVYTDKYEYEKIISLQDEVLAFMDDTQIKDTSVWFEEPCEDEEMPSGIAVGTEVHNGKCTFLNKAGHCVLQSLAISKGENPWKYKPYYCVLFPLTVYEGALTIDDEHIARTSACSLNKDTDVTIYDSCREELKYTLGDDGFIELENYRKEYLDSITFTRE